MHKTAIYRFGLFCHRCFVNACLAERTKATAARRADVIRFIRDPDPASEFAVKGINGGTVNLAAARGKVVLLNVWVARCGSRRMEVPNLVELQKKYSDPAAGGRAGG